MTKSLSFVLLTLVGVACTGTAIAQSATLNTSPKVIQVAASNAEKPVMSYQVAALMQTLQKAQAQYRRSGQTQDLARVEAMRRELASRGFGRTTQSAPVLMAQTGSTPDAAGSVRVSLAD
ncbi:MAG: hypothetical protein PHH58_01680 [Rhodoferax sp.]|nr:hypothetical protein [Rhodoferax sp.]